MTSRLIRSSYRRIDPAAYSPICSISLAPVAGMLLICASIFAAVGSMRTHVLLVDMPLPELHADAPVEGVYRVGVTADGVATLNGEQIELDALRELRLREGAGYTPTALVFTPDADASYGASVLVLAALWDSNGAGERFCFGDLARHKDFDSGIIPPLFLTLLPPEPPTVVTDRAELNDCEANLPSSSFIEP